jgi:hypothetical protein
MKYFSGFCLKNENKLFEQYLIKNNFNIAGFSYGAINATEYTFKMLSKNKRIDTLQLFSPAWFLDKDDKFKRLQLIYFQKNKKQYIDNFIKNILYPNAINVDISKYIKNGKKDELDVLLNYKWNLDILKQINNSGVKIEIYLGECDKIINVDYAKDFFKDFGETYFIKGVGHTLL